MREILIMIKAGFRRGKTEFSGVIILTFLFSLTLMSILTININTAKRDMDAIEEASFGDILMAVADQKLEWAGLSIKELSSQIADVDEVKRVQRIDSVCAYIKEVNHKAKEDNNQNILLAYPDSGLTYAVYTKDMQKSTGDFKLDKGEIGVPFSFQSLFDCEIGDTLTFWESDGEKSYQIKAFFEDPVMGSAMMGIKTLLLNADDVKRIRKDSSLAEAKRGKKDPYPMALLNITQKESSSLSSLEFEKLLNDKTGAEKYADMTLSMEQAADYMLIVTNIFTRILAAFVVLLLIILLIVIGHGINTSIEMEYSNLGILRAVGLSAGKLKISMFLQYLIASVLGMILGIPAAAAIIRIVNGMIRPVTGLVVANEFAVAHCLLAMAVGLLVIICLVQIKLLKVTSITPLKAITNGREDVYFSSRMQTKLHRRGLDYFLALRQLVFGKKQYISVGIIGMLLVFFLTQTASVNHWMGEDGSNLSKIFNCFDAQIDVSYVDKSLQTKVEEIIEKETPIMDSFQAKSAYLSLNGNKFMSFVCDDPDEFVTVYEGRTCTYENEVLLTQFLADQLGVTIGDTVEVQSSGSKEAEYIVSGFYQSANDMGSNFAMSLEGYQRIAGKAEEMESMLTAYRLQDKEKADIIIKKLKARYGEEDIITGNLNYFSQIDSILAAIKGISVLIYMIAGVLVLTVVSMVCGKIFIREKRDYGIYKALGFTGRSLRYQFALRFAFVAFIGCVGGILIDFMFSDACMGIILSMMGCTIQEERVDPMIFVLPCVFILILFFGFSYLKAGKIRMVEPTLLIEE